jgi:hypothetical protein
MISCTNMNRRDFMQQAAACAGAMYSAPGPLTEHIILIVIGGGARKKDYLQNETLAPNISRLAGEGFVFEEDHSERVASHRIAFAELLQGREFNPSGAAFPTILDYAGNGVLLDAVRSIPQIMTQSRPRVSVCRQMTHDVGHDSYEKYLGALKATDDAIGSVFDWVKSHPSFRRNTAIVLRPEFGRDDEINEFGQLHHSYGFYSTHRVASIFWGPDFNQGVNKECVIRAVDMVPTLARLLKVKASYAQGRVVPGLSKPEALST